MTAKPAIIAGVEITPGARLPNVTNFLIWRPDIFRRYEVALVATEEK